MENKPKSKRGFASISPERRREIASMGGKSAHAKGTAHKYTSETGRAASLKAQRNAKAAEKESQ
jgi:hypothetical protein